MTELPQHGADLPGGAPSASATPLVSFVTDAGHGSRRDLAVTAASLAKLSHSDWEWTIVDRDANWLTRRLLRKLGAHANVHVRPERGAPRGSALNAAFADAAGRWISVLEPGDKLAIDALEMVFAAETSYPAAWVLYGDYPVVALNSETSGVISWTPDFSPERLLAQDYCSRTSFFHVGRMGKHLELRDEYGSAQGHDLVLRATEVASEVRHIRAKLHTSLAPDAGLDVESLANHERVAKDALSRRGESAQLTVSRNGVIEVRRQSMATPLVSLIIPTNGTAREVFGETRVLAERAMTSVTEFSTYPDIEFVVVYDEGTPASFLDAIRDRSDVVLLPYDKPFNFAEKCNIGAKEAHGDIVVFLNDDTQVITPDWLELMVAVLETDGVGAVGPMLRYESGDVQSAGHTSHSGCVANVSPLKFKQIAAIDPAVLECASERSGVTGACLAMHRDFYTALGGMKEEFFGAYNDVDLCFRILEAGRRVVWVPFAELYHFEHMSREGKLSTLEELALLRERWAPLLLHDPYLPVPQISIRGEWWEPLTAP